MSIHIQVTIFCDARDCVASAHTTAVFDNEGKPFITVPRNWCEYNPTTSDPHRHYCQKHRDQASHASAYGGGRTRSHSPPETLTVMEESKT